jgi:hypothetical protein
MGSAPRKCTNSLENDGCISIVCWRVDRCSDGDCLRGREQPLNYRWRTVDRTATPDNAANLERPHLWHYQIYAAGRRSGRSVSSAITPGRSRGRSAKKIRLSGKSFALVRLVRIALTTPLLIIRTTSVGIFRASNKRLKPC